MTARVLSGERLAVASGDDVEIVRRKVRQNADALGFDQLTSAAITTATSELCHNIWVHAGNGSALVEQIASEGQVGIRIVFEDAGPGITDVDRVLAGGNAKSPDLGISGSRRLVDDFRIETTVGKGTTITVVKWKRHS